MYTHIYTCVHTRMYFLTTVFSHLPLQQILCFLVVSKLLGCFFVVVVVVFAKLSFKRIIKMIFFLLKGGPYHKRCLDDA